LDDSAARKEWGWTPKYTLEAMTADMLQKIEQRLERPREQTTR
jgi:nucleoside-diphosphate-sugar epimerase